MPKKKRDYKQEYANESSERRKFRAQRNKARRHMISEGKAKVGDGKDVGHKKALSKGGKTTPKNLVMQSASENRSFARTSTRKMKSETSKRERKRRGRS